MAETASIDALSAERRGPVGILRIDRPKVLNALNEALIDALVSTMEAWDRDPQIRVMVLTGGDRVFAVGADIAEMANVGVAEWIETDRLAKWARIRNISKPVIAAVAGYALGGGCELVLACDLIVAAETAIFGQPEISLGIMPGAGGTQRLTRVFGRYRAMEICLAGRRFTALEAMRWGLVCKVVPPDKLLEEAVGMAERIASQAPLAVRLIKEAVHAAEDLDRETALKHERRLFYLLFGTKDQKEGMKAFLEKRKPDFKGE
jgi:enoyl-CoA hydratase